MRPNPLLRIFLDRPGKEALSQRAERNESNPECLEGGNDFLFGLSVDAPYSEQQVTFAHLLQCVALPLQMAPAINRAIANKAEAISRNIFSTLLRDISRP
jgi:hypothetical protein